MPFILRLKRVIELLEMVDMLVTGEPSKIVVWRDEHSQKYKKFIARVSSCQETFFKGLKDWRILKHRFAYGRGTKGLSTGIDSYYPDKT